MSSTNCSYGLGSCEGGNIHLLYGPPPGSVSAVGVTGSTSVMSIDSCTFSDGVDVSIGSKGQYSSGLGIYYFAALQYSIDISICNVLSTRNVGKRGANFLFLNIGNINITNSTSSMANYLPQGGALQGTGFLISYRVLDPSIQIPTTKALLYISDSKFHNNNGTGFHFQLYEVYNNVTYNVIIKNCSFERNMNPTGSGVIIAQIAAQVSTLSSTSGLEVLVQDTNFTNHTISEQMSNVQALNAFTAFNLKHLKIVNRKFAMNKQTALQALDSTNVLWRACNLLRKQWNTWGSSETYGLAT